MFPIHRIPIILLVLHGFTRLQAVPQAVTPNMQPLFLDNGTQSTSTLPGPADALFTSLAANARNQQDINDASVVLRDVAPHYANKAALWRALVPYIVIMKAPYAFEELWERTYGCYDGSNRHDGEDG